MMLLSFGGLRFKAVTERMEMSAQAKDVVVLRRGML